MDNTERIAMGECVSEFTTDRCPVCTDRCEAFRHKCQINELKELAENARLKDEGWSWNGVKNKAHYFTHDEGSGYYFSLCMNQTRGWLQKPERGLDPYEKCKMCMEKDKKRKLTTR
ncbi:hypothetical protein [Rufibacter soli]